MVRKHISIKLLSYPSGTTLKKKLTYGKVKCFLVLSCMSFNACIDSCTHHHNLDTQQFHHPRKLSCCPFVVTLSPTPNPCYHQSVLTIVLPFPESPVSGIRIICNLLKLSSFPSCPHTFEIHSGCCIYQ